MKNLNLTKITYIGIIAFGLYSCGADSEEVDVPFQIEKESAPNINPDLTPFDPLEDIEMSVTLTYRQGGYVHPNDSLDLKKKITYYVSEYERKYFNQDVASMFNMNTSQKNMLIHKMFLN